LDGPLVRAATKHSFYAPVRSARVGPSKPRRIHVTVPIDIGSAAVMH